MIARSVVTRRLLTPVTKFALSFTVLYLFMMFFGDPVMEILISAVFISPVLIAFTPEV